MITNTIREITYKTFGIIGLVLMIPPVVIFKIALVVANDRCTIGELIEDVVKSIHK